MSIEPGAMKALGITLLIVESFTLPIFRSGGRQGLSFWAWVWNHTIFGPPVEYVPEEDYMVELQAAGIVSSSGIIDDEAVARAMVFFKVDTASARRMLSPY